jgi:hypothetical protein
LKVRSKLFSNFIIGKIASNKNFASLAKVFVFYVSIIITISESVPSFLLLHYYNLLYWFL